MKKYLHNTGCFLMQFVWVLILVLVITIAFLLSSGLDGKLDIDFIEIFTTIVFGIFFIISRKLNTDEDKYGLNPISFKTILHLLFIAIALNLFISIVISFIPKEFLDTSGYTIASDISIDTKLTPITVGILAPLNEELTFRYFSYNSFKKINKKAAAITSAVLFGLAHFNPIQGIYSFIAGLIIIYFNEREKSILPGCVVHIGVNFVTCMMLVVIGERADPESAQIGILALLLIIVFFISWNLKRRK